MGRERVQGGPSVGSSHTLLHQRAEDQGVHTAAGVLPLSLPGSHGQELWSQCGVYWQVRATVCVCVWWVVGGVDLYIWILCFVVHCLTSLRELSRFIASGRLHCRIDKVGGVVETNRPDSKNFLYQVYWPYAHTHTHTHAHTHTHTHTQSTIKQGDLLLNRVQKLSRVINI